MSGPENESKRTEQKLADKRPRNQELERIAEIMDADGWPIVSEAADGRLEIYAAVRPERIDELCEALQAWKAKVGEV